MFLAANVREEDAAEVQSVAGLTPLEALTIGLFHSKDCVTGLGRTGDPVLIAGVVKTGQPQRHGSIWMLSTPEIRHNLRAILTEGKSWVGNMADKYGDLSNVSAVENTGHHRIIQALGFTLEPPITDYGPRNATVVPFHRKQSHV